MIQGNGEKEKEKNTITNCIMNHHRASTLNNDKKQKTTLPTYSIRKPIRTPKKRTQIGRRT